MLSVCAANAQKTKQAPRRPLPTTKNVNAVVGCSVFNNSQNYTCGNSFTIAAPIDDNSGYTDPAGANWDCYGSRPNQVWFLFTVTSPGTLTFTINGINNSNNFYDIDGIIWGPIPNGNYSNACSVTANQPITCDYDTGSADLVVPNAQVGQVYTMLVTNFSNEANTIYINQPTGGAVNYCMANLPAVCYPANATITGTQTILQSQPANLTLSFTGTSPWNYTLSNGISGTTSTSPFNIVVSPSQTTTYTITSLSNSCGTGTTSGSAIVTIGPSYVHSPAGLLSCYSFTGNAQDEINSNNGIPQNVSLTADRYGSINSAYQFSGSSSSYVSIANPNTFTTNNYTYSGWIKATTLPNSTAWIFGIGQGGVGDQSLYLFYNNGSVSFAAHAYANPTYCLTALNSANSGVTVTQNQWYHITITMGPSAYKMYVNGKLVATSPSSCVSMIYGTPTAHIGSRLGYLSPFTGIIDDFRIYDRELSAEEVNNVMYTKGCRSTCPENLSLINTYTNTFPLREEAAQIIATNTVSSVSKLRYDGTNSVLLQPGFKVEQGAVFEAINNGCGGSK
jgi:Concanavalin A-like lectin/glucanases superfamily